ncbi:hypothetical protein P2D89_05490 [Agrobacterium rhizogenes]|uniref:hypothetical protein n=1 Tax=Rhizobium rhizogenes TaxID=359 RepID=UPI002863AC1D|nr:hypothetical protein [Rhizobium rhizogenes]MDF1888430.1 hypothetical protein [Rhizobium rhizogenes]
MHPAGAEQNAYHPPNILPSRKPYPIFTPMPVTARYQLLKLIMMRVDWISTACTLKFKHVHKKNGEKGLPYGKNAVPQPAYAPAF